MTIHCAHVARSAQQQKAWPILLLLSVNESALLECQPSDSGLATSCTCFSRGRYNISQWLVAQLILIMVRLFIYVYVASTLVATYACVYTFVQFYLCVGFMPVSNPQHS